VLAVLLGVTDFYPADDQYDQGQVEGQTEGHVDQSGGCGAELERNAIAFLVTLCVTLSLEIAVTVFSMRGSILNVQPRSAIPYLLYARFGLFDILSFIRWWFVRTKTYLKQPY